MSQQQNPPEFNEDDSSSAIGTIFTISNENENELNELKCKIAALEAKNQLFEVTNKHLEEKLKNLEEKQIQEKKYAELETRMRDKSLERKLQEGELKMVEISQEMANQKEHFQKEIALLKAANLEEKKELAKEMGKIENGKAQNNKLNYSWSYLARNKRLANPRANHWNDTTTKATLSDDELEASNKQEQWQLVYAVQSFGISGEFYPKDEIPAGPILYYFEVKVIPVPSSHWTVFIALSDGNIKVPKTHSFVISPNCYCYSQERGDFCLLDYKIHNFEWPKGAVKPKWNGQQGNVLGCGLLLHADNQLSIFFTGEGILLGKPFPISPSVDRLFPTVNIWNASVEANFGDNLVAKPFKFDIEKYPGLMFE